MRIHAVIGAVAIGLVSAVPFATANAATTAIVQPPGLDHFQCYSLNAQQTSPGTKVPPSVILIDQFQSRQVTVGKKPNQVCVPVTKIRTDIDEVAKPQNPDANLLCYPVRNTAADPTRQVKVQNQFGDAQLTVGDPTRLCLPTSLTPPPTGGVWTIPQGLDHFLCYKSTYTKNAAGGVLNKFENQPPSVRLIDRWTDTIRKPGAPAELCNPVNKIRPDIPTENNAPRNPEAHLVCVKLDPRTSVNQAPALNQFGRGAIVTAQSRTLCLPSYKQLIPGTGPVG